ncbi:LuxR C-terminal-related transcriptional regulator [Novipirellula sp. SH528]|uniref:LuxR C-terminal-related transcriptional regulator n=1 Tax=Novipirellula sp. SH528 TaxID=3454466 RepID=UPI003FA01052
MKKPNRSISSDSATITRRKSSGGKRATSGGERITAILKTKLRPPNMLPGLVARSRLMDLLQQNPRRPLTLVSAPAGYGKTTVVTQWLHAVKTKHAWLSLDEGDNDLRSFLRHFVSAIQLQIPKACPATMSLLQAAQLPHAIVLAETLSNELDAIAVPFILVLDDYHLIAETTIHELMENLLRHPPRPLHLVLVTRHDPPLSLAGLRARGWLTEIRQDALRFSRPEVKAVLKEMTGTTLSDRALAHLELEMEGWMVGLYLVGLLLRNQAEPEEFVLGLKGGSQQIHEYLSEEVISQQPAMVRDRLLKVSMVDRFCAPLVDALIKIDDATVARTTGKEFIEVIRRANLFVIPLDVKGKWFRFHHLFQYLLQGQLQRGHSRDEIAALHLSASKWHEAQGLIDDAIRHSLAANDIERAAEIVERHAREMMNEDKCFVVDKWLSQLPDSIVQQRPKLLLSRAWTYYFRFNLAAIPPILDRVDEVTADVATTQDLSGEVAFFRGFVEFLQGHGTNSVRHIEFALNHINRTHHEFRAEAEVLFGLAGQMEGELDRVTRALTEWLADPSPLHPLRETRLLVTLVFVYYIAGDLVAAQQYLPRLRLVAGQNDMQNPLAWCDYLDGLIHLQRGELDAAIGLLKEAVKGKYLDHARAAVDALAALMIACEVRGQSKQANATKQDLIEFVDHLGPIFQPLADASATRLDLMRRQADAADYRPDLLASTNEVMLFWFEIPCLTRCRALIRVGSTDSLNEAAERLQESAETNEKQHNRCHQIQVASLQALVCEMQGKTEDAMQCLEHAVTMAQPGGFVFPFMELGPPMAALLRRFRLNCIAVEFVDRLLTLIPNASSDVEGNGSGVGESPSLVQPLTNSLPNPSSESMEAATDDLTNRELETLELLSQRLYDKEIAKAMSISVWTVKSHVKHIYEKLHVTNRRQAVAKAEQLGLLTGS